MEDRLITFAAGVIAKANKENPADAVLKQELRSELTIGRLQTGDLSRIVFSYYRWYGWLDHARPVTAQLKRAIELANGFGERPESFSDEKMLERCVPPWIHEQLDVSPQWILTLQSQPKLWLRARHGQGPDLAKKLHSAKARSVPDAVLYLREEDLFRTPEFQAGEFEIQDIASQVVGLLCDPQPTETWWDACAGEGGKLLHLSDLMQNKGLIWASDRAEWRLRKLKQRAARARAFNYRSVPWDGGVKPPTKTKFNGVLVDAPCTGVGTWQRNPHARWTTTPQDVAELAEVQKNLLRHVAGSVKPGGKLIYSVCTLTQAETTGVVETLNQELTGFDPLPLADFVQPGSPAAPVRTIWPQDLGGNGMFIAAWRKK